MTALASVIWKKKGDARQLNNMRQKRITYSCDTLRTTRPHIIVLDCRRHHKIQMNSVYMSFRESTNNERFFCNVPFLHRFGKKKDDKSKDAAKVAKNKLEAWSEEEFDRFHDIRER